MCRPSPVPFEQSTRLKMTYLWFLAQKVLNRLYYALHGNPRKEALTKTDANDMVAKLGLNDIPTLLGALRRRFPSDISSI